MARLTVEAPEATTKPIAVGGSADPLDEPIRSWFDWAKGQRSVEAWTDDGVSHLTVDSEDCAMSTLQYVLSRGGDVRDAPVFIKMSTATYAAAVPDGISNRTYTDDADVEQTRNWDKWKDSNHNHMDADDGDKIVPGNSWGAELTSDELKVLSADSDYTLYLAHEVSAVLPTPQGV